MSMRILLSNMISEYLTFLSWHAWPVRTQVTFALSESCCFDIEIISILILFQKFKVSHTQCPAWFNLLETRSIRVRIEFWFFTIAMDESSYAAALDAITFDQHTTRIHYYDSNQEENGVWNSWIYFLLCEIVFSRRCFLLTNVLCIQKIPNLLGNLSIVSNASFQKWYAWSCFIRICIELRFAN